jgi:prolyl-tRNA synthetase
MKMSVRCMPLDQERKPATCIITGQKTDRWAIFAKSY